MSARRLCCRLCAIVPNKIVQVGKLLDSLLLLAHMESRDILCIARRVCTAIIVQWANGDPHYECFAPDIRLCKERSPLKH